MWAWTRIVSLALAVVGCGGARAPQSSADRLTATAPDEPAPRDAVPADDATAPPPPTPQGCVTFEDLRPRLEPLRESNHRSFVRAVEALGIDPASVGPLPVATGAVPPQVPSPAPGVEVAHQGRRFVAGEQHPMRFSRFVPHADLFGRDRQGRLHLLRPRTPPEMRARVERPVMCGCYTGCQPAEYPLQWYLAEGTDCVGPTGVAMQGPMFGWEFHEVPAGVVVGPPLDVPYRHTAVLPTEEGAPCAPPQ